MVHALLIGLLVLQAQDTSLRMTGFVRVAGDSRDSSQAWLELAYPVAASGGRVRGFGLTGDAGKWSRYADRYVEVEGRMIAAAVLEATRVREVKPPGEARRDVDPSFTQHATATLAVVPQRIRWRDGSGQPTGVAPSAYYTIRNHGDTPLVFLFSSPDVLCIAVTRYGSGDADWRDAWRPPKPNERVNVEMGAAVRYLAPIPEKAAPTPGRYTAHVSLCGIPDYEVSAEFEVVEAGS
jgi:hypothetical protein